MGKRKMLKLLFFGKCLLTVSVIISNVPSPVGCQSHTGRRRSRRRKKEKKNKGDSNRIINTTIRKRRSQSNATLTVCHRRATAATGVRVLDVQGVEGEEARIIIIE